MEDSIIFLPERYKGSSVVIKHHLNNSLGVIVVKVCPTGLADESFNSALGLEDIFKNWREYTHEGPAFLLFTKDAPINYKHSIRAQNGQFASATFVSTCSDLSPETVFIPYLKNKKFLFSTEYRTMMERIHTEHGGSSLFIVDGCIRIFGLSNGKILPSGAWRSHEVKPVSLPKYWNLIKKPKVEYNPKWEFDNRLGTLVYDSGKRHRATTFFNAYHTAPDKVVSPWADDQDIAWAKLLAMLDTALGTKKQKPLDVRQFAQAVEM